MKRNILVICLVLIIESVSAQKSDITPKIRWMKNDTLVWSCDTCLVKENYKGKARTNGPLGATCSAIFMYPSENGGNMTITVAALFIESKSYITKNSDYILKHERLHFDICELYARKLRQKISSVDFKKVHDIGTKLKNLYMTINTEYDRTQQKYDDETQHGLNPAKQQVWCDDIAKQLKDMDSYSATELNLVK